MAYITRHNPLDVTDPFASSDSLDTLFRGFFRPVSVDRSAPQIRMDVRENDRQYAVHADIPGVNKDDIHVSIDGNTVSISAELKTETAPNADETVLRRERSTGRVSRRFALESEIDESAAHARYQDGVLELVLPKKVPAEARRLAVQ